MQKKRFIAHVDMDAFFAAIEQRDNSAYRGKPVVVGADPKKGKGRGVVSTCSYEARKFGIHSGLPISIAYQKCPCAIFLPVNMGKYSDISQEINDILYDFTPAVESVSIDEAFLDITGSYHLFGSPVRTCLLIKSKIKQNTSLTASVGLAPTKMAAKIASDLKKPDGFLEVKEEDLLAFLRPLDIRKIWGLGKASEGALRGIGINTIGDLAKRSPEELQKILGRNGIHPALSRKGWAHFWQLSNGIDERGVEAERDAKSISNEITFDKDTADSERIEGVLMSLCEQVSTRLRNDDIKGRTITLKIRLTGFHTYTRAVTIRYATNFADVLYKEIKKLYNTFDKKGKRVRLVGVKVSNLSESNIRMGLFEDTADKKREDIHRATDRIKGKFGNVSIYRASRMRTNRLANVRKRKGY